jgi:hypothetical protein
MEKQRHEQTGKKAGTAASKTLRGTGTRKDAKSAAGSALTQRPNKTAGRGARRGR